MPITDDEVRVLLESMNRRWRDYWCEAEICACLGCANSAGRLNELGVTKEQWQRVMTAITSGSTMIDLVAGAIMRAYFDRPEDIREINVSVPDQRDIARAAIEALRLPTPTMTNAGLRDAEGFNLLGVPDHVLNEAFTRMIDAALTSDRTSDTTLQPQSGP